MLNKVEKGTLLVFTALSGILFVLEWSKSGFTQTATAGAGTVAVSAFITAFAGPILGGALGLLVMLGRKLFSKEAKFPYTLLVCIWGLFLLSAVMSPVIESMR